jgi:hypothetical protein
MPKPHPGFEIPEIKTFPDGRKSISDIYADLLKIADADWEVHKICDSEADEAALPIISFSTRKHGPALWIISGIHGEEPAGPIAISESMSVIKNYAKKTPVVLIPLCNPQGYRRDWRYLDMPRNIEGKVGKGVGISKHLLLRCKETRPNSPENDALTRFVVSMARTHPPFIAFDMHEDDELDRAYIYSQGGRKDKVAQFVLRKYREWGVAVQESGKTSFDEKVEKGIVGYTEDDSIDELIFSTKIRRDRKFVDGPGAKTMIVTELPSRAMKLKERVDIYKKLLSAIDSEMLKAAQSI